MKLEKLTKEDLLWVLREAQKNKNGDLAISIAMHKLEVRKFNQRMERSEELNTIITDCRIKAADLLKPYSKLSEVPTNILEEVRNLLNQAERADREWEKLMDVDREVGP